MTQVKTSINITSSNINATSLEKGEETFAHSEGKKYFCARLFRTGFNKVLSK